MTCMKRGESLFIPFAKGLGVPNSQGRTRMYKSMASLEKLMPKDHGNVEVAEYSEVKHGEWRLHPDGSGTCNQCGRTQKAVWDFDNAQEYCGKCGAKMDGGKAE